MKTRILLTAMAAILVAPLTVSTTLAEESLHPLQVHMNQWLTGSRDWRTPNPNYTPPAAGEPDNGFPEFSVYWEWRDDRKAMFGELTGVRTDGSKTLFWSMYAFYNPATKQVLYMQVHTNGTLISSEHPVRTSPVAYGEVEQLDTTTYMLNGTTWEARHENVFSADGTHVSNVYRKNESGEWEPTNTWNWALTSAEESG